MTLHLTYRDSGQIKIIEILYIVIRPVGKSTHYLQQACISNLLVTVFAARRFDRYVPAKNSTLQPKLSTHDKDANTAP